MWQIPPKFLEPSSAESTGWFRKSFRGAKMVHTCSIYMQCLVTNLVVGDRKVRSIFVCLFMPRVGRGL